ncbi:MAG: hypothetical protein WBW75_18490 [Mycobacterium sp.]|uniref:hypothetical protein n=1 Tax=Mycobacterium sp. TaxID=1785 RepID=UPI003C4BABE4
MFYAPKNGLEKRPENGVEKGERKKEKNSLDVLHRLTLVDSNLVSLMQQEN